MRPSEAILGPPREELQQRYYGQLLHFENLVAYLDEEAERRAAFEADVLERLVKLEANHRSCSAGGCCEIDREWGQCVKCGVGLASEALDPTKPLYVGDGAPRVRCFMPLCADGRPVHDMQGQAACPSCGYVPRLVKYEPDAAEPEPEVTR